MKPIQKIINSIYIHIPFCLKKCNYCAFTIHAIGLSKDN